MENGNKMNKRIMLIAILLLNLLVAATTVLARELSEPSHAMTLATTAGAGIAHLAQPAEQSLRLAGSTAFPTANGRATVDTAGREIEVEVDGLGALAGQTVDVVIGGARAGSMTIGTDGRGAFHAEGDSAAAILAAANGMALELRAGAVVVAASQLPADDNSDANDNDGDDDNGDDDNDNANDNGGDDNANDNGDDDDANDNSDDNGDDNANDNGDNDDANDNSDDDNAPSDSDDNGDDDNAPSDSDDNGDDDNAPSDSDDNSDDDNANDNSDDDNANDNGDDDDNDNSDDDNANDNGDDDDNSEDDDSGNDNDDHGGHN